MAATALAEQLVKELTARGITITTAESCTGGLIAAAITDISGASSVFHQGIISYANSAKTSLLGVNAETIKHYGAVSDIVAREMAEGARIKANADFAISATGIAGPTGGTAEKPVGLVYIAVSSKQSTEVKRCQFAGNRKDIRKQAVQHALELALIAVRQNSQ